jgi:hypothetical protein
MNLSISELINISIACRKYADICKKRAQTISDLNAKRLEREVAAENLRLVRKMRQEIEKRMTFKD